LALVLRNVEAVHRQLVTGRVMVSAVVPRPVAWCACRWPGGPRVKRPSFHQMAAVGSAVRGDARAELCASVL